MRPPKACSVRIAVYALLSTTMIGLAGCGGSSSDSTSTANPPTSTVNNTQTVEVNAGPALDGFL